MRRTVVIASLLVAGTLHLAHAEDRAMAERYFRLGEKAYQAQNFEAAGMNFEEAYKQFPLAEIAFSAAQAYRRQYRIDPKPEYVALAVKHYKTYLGKVKSGGRVADAADALSEMQHELEKLVKSGVKVSEELARDYTILNINPSLGKQTSGGGMQEVADTDRKQVATITVRLDGKPAEPFAPINVTPGEHRIEVAADGYFTQEKVTNVQQGASQIADIELAPKPAKVTVRTEGGAKILVDGRPQPGAAFEIDAGRHVVSILHRGRNGVARELTVRRGQELTLDEPLEMTARRRVVPWLLVGSGVAFALTGVNVVLALRKDSQASDLLDNEIRGMGDQTQATLDRYNDARTWRDRYVVASWATGAACVGLAGIAALLYYTDNPSPDDVRVEPMATSGGAGAAIAGRF
jgi:hypothetical protein